MSPLLEVAGLFVSVRGEPVLRGVDLAVERGSLVALLGANGSGKSTLLDAICGHRSPDRGSVRFDGAAARSYPSREWGRRVAMVPQLHELPPGFTVREIVAMGRHPHVGLFGAPAAADHEAVERAMSFLGVERFADRSVDHLSGGERQGVVLALALAQEPEALLLDEPTAHLDIRHEARIMESVRTACDGRNLAALVVVHDIELARRYADRVALLEGGRILRAGTPAEVLVPECLATCFGVAPEFFHRAWGQGAAERLP